MRFWKLSEGEEPTLIGELLYKGIVRALAFSRAGKTLVAGSQDRTLRLWDAETGLPLSEPFMLDSPVVAVALSPDGKTVLAGTATRCGPV